MTPVEKHYIKLATRGVVQLFNAVQKQHSIVRQQVKENTSETLKREVLQAVKREEEEEMRKSTRDEMSVKIEPAEDEKIQSNDLPYPHSSTKNSANTNGTRNVNSSGWSALREDYLMNNKLKDWDKAVGSEEED